MTNELLIDLERQEEDWPTNKIAFGKRINPCQSSRSENPSRKSKFNPYDGCYELQCDKVYYLLTKLFIYF